MKTCPVCALDLEDAYLFCPDDGSSLDSIPGRSANALASATESDDETAGAVVLYCPACAAEYPLTFSTCPVHGEQLTKHRIPRLSNRRPELREHPAAGDAQASAAGLLVRRRQSKLTKQLTTLDLKRPQIESSKDVPVPLISDELITDGDTESAQAGDLTVSDFPLRRPRAFAGGVAAFNYQGAVTDAQERRFEQPGFRIAAIATVIALAIFGLGALYAFVSNLSRRAPVVKVASKTESTPLPFVPTPQAAQDYKEEAPASAASVPPEPEPARPVERTRIESPSSSPTELGVRKTTIAQPLPRPPVTPVPAVTTTRVSSPPALPPGNSGGFDARLIRVRSRKTPAGFRYDLTFNMQEQGVRSAQWQRLLISTRSASGTSHSEAIPFSHRLGAAGALTFTISVELAGRSEADWQGRIVCTTLGWDNKGAPLQASFGANVTP